MYNYLKKVACFAITLSCAVSGDAIATQEYGNPWRHTLASPPTDATRRAFSKNEFKQFKSDRGLCFIPSGLWNWAVESVEHFRTAVEIGNLVDTAVSHSDRTDEIIADLTAGKTSLSQALVRLYEDFIDDNKFNEPNVAWTMRTLYYIEDDPGYMGDPADIGGLYVYFFERLIDRRNNTSVN